MRPVRDYILVTTMASSPQKSPSSPKSPTPKSPSSRKKDDSFLGKLGGTLARRKKAKEGKELAKQLAGRYQDQLSVDWTSYYSVTTLHDITDDTSTYSEFPQLCNSNAATFRTANSFNTLPWAWTRRFHANPTASLRGRRLRLYPCKVLNQVL